MEDIKQFILQEWFYILGILYIADLVYDIYLRIKNKPLDLKVDITDTNSIMDSNKKTSKKILNCYNVISFIVFVSWMIVGINGGDFLEKFYFMILFTSSYIIPIIVIIISSISVYSKMKDEGEMVITSDELNKTSLIKNQKMFYNFLNVFEILVVVLILRNHFLF